MYSSCGLFRNVTCPFFASGLCYRPYCHFKHAAESAAPTRPASAGGLLQRASDGGCSEPELGASAVASSSARSGGQHAYTPTPKLLLGAAAAAPAAAPPPAYKPTPINELRTAAAGQAAAVPPPLDAAPSDEPAAAKAPQPPAASQGAGRRRPTTIEYDPESNYRTPDGLVDGARHRAPSSSSASQADACGRRAAGQGTRLEDKRTAEVPSQPHHGELPADQVKAGGAGAHAETSERRLRKEGSAREPPRTSTEASSKAVVAAELVRQAAKQTSVGTGGSSGGGGGSSSGASCETNATETNSKAGAEPCRSQSGRTGVGTDVHSIHVETSRQDRQSTAGDDKKNSSPKPAGDATAPIGHPANDASVDRNRNRCPGDVVHAENPLVNEEYSSPLTKPGPDVLSTVPASTSTSDAMARRFRLLELKVVLHRLEDVGTSQSHSSQVKHKRRRVLSWSSPSSSSSLSDFDGGQQSSHARSSPVPKRARLSPEQASLGSDDSPARPDERGGPRAPKQLSNVFRELFGDDQGNHSSNEHASSFSSADRNGSLISNTSSCRGETGKTSVTRTVSKTNVDGQVNKTSMDRQVSKGSAKKEIVGNSHSGRSSLSGGRDRLARLVILSSDDDEGGNNVNKRSSSVGEDAKRRNAPDGTRTGVSSVTPAVPVISGEPLAAPASSAGSSALPVSGAATGLAVHPSKDITSAKKRVAHASASAVVKSSHLSKPAALKKPTPAEALQARYDVQKQQAVPTPAAGGVASGAQLAVPARSEAAEPVALAHRVAGSSGSVSLAKLASQQPPPSQLPQRQLSVNDLGQCSKPPGGSNVAPKSSAAHATVGKTSKSDTRKAHQPSEAAKILLSRPRVKADGHSSRVPLNLRQNCLDRLVDVSVKLYKSVDSAYERAIRDEESAYGRSSTRKVYINLMALAITKLRAERSSVVGDSGEAGPVATSDRPASARLSQDSGRSIKSNSVRPSTAAPSATVSHDVVLLGKAHGNVTLGLKKKERSTVAEVTASSLKGSAFCSHLQRYVLTEEQLVDNGFPRPVRGVTGSSVGSAVVKWSEKYDKRPQMTGDKKLCARCGKGFIVLPGGTYAKPQEECSYHWGRRIKKKVSGQVDLVYTCCQGNGSAQPCVSAKSHVYDSNKYDDLTGFIETPVADGGSTAYSVDCEMVYTTAGIELARVTLIDDSLNVVFDAIVRPSHSIVDCNTRFSGLTEISFHGVTATFHETRSRLLKIINNRTILMGHSLENDLRTLKLFHDQVVDTSVVFPHRLGPPLKRPLRDLVAENLMKIIQDDGDTGHDSAADARACMELMKWKVAQDIKKEMR